MHGLLSDRFLKKFAGKRKDRWKRLLKKPEDQGQETGAEKIGGSVAHETDGTCGQAVRDGGDAVMPGNLQQQTAGSPPGSTDAHEPNENCSER